jgi:hypothetical protein
MIVISPSPDHERFCDRPVVRSFTATPRLMQPERWVPPKIQAEVRLRNDNLRRLICSTVAQLD